MLEEEHEGEKMIMTDEEIYIMYQLIAKFLDQFNIPINQPGKLILHYIMKENQIQFTKYEIYAKETVQ